MVGPSGPRRLRLAVEHLAQHRGGICFMVDLDPRWVIKLIKNRQMDQMEAYKRHVIDQALTLLRAHDNIKCLFTTPKLLEALCEKVSLKKMGIRGVFCGGTEMTPQFHRFAVEELLDGVYFAPTYGNTLMGLATHKPPEPEDNYAIIYYPPTPRAMIEVVDPDQPDRVVDYGETGRVRLTTLTKEFFMPRFLERDEAEREPPCRAVPVGRRPQRAARSRRFGRRRSSRALLSGSTSQVLCDPESSGRPALGVERETDDHASPPDPSPRRSLQSLDVVRVPHHRTREPFVEISQANAGLIRRDLPPGTAGGGARGAGAVAVRRAARRCAREAADHFLERHAAARRRRAVAGRLRPAAVGDDRHAARAGAPQHAARSPA